MIFLTTTYLIERREKRGERPRNREESERDMFRKFEMGFKNYPNAKQAQNGQPIGTDTHLTDPSISSLAPFDHLTDRHQISPLIGLILAWFQLSRV